MNSKAPSKQVTLRLHRQHDLDLISLYRTKGYHLGKEIKKALIAYTKGEIYVPPELESTPEPGYVKKINQLHIVFNLNNPDEAQAYLLITNVDDGYRNSFVKTVFRGSLPYLPLSAYSGNTDMIMKKPDALIQIHNAQKKALEKQKDHSETVKEKQNVFAEESEPISAAEETDKNPISASQNANVDEDFTAFFSQMSSLNH